MKLGKHDCKLQKNNPNMIHPTARMDHLQSLGSATCFFAHNPFEFMMKQRGSFTLKTNGI